MLGGYGEFMYQTGMIDELQKQYVNQQTDIGVKFIQQQKWVEAFEVRGAVYPLLNFINFSDFTPITNHSINACCEYHFSTYIFLK